MIFKELYSVLNIYMSVIGRGDLLCKNVIIKKLSIKIH